MSISTRTSYDDIHYTFISMKVRETNVCEYNNFEWFKLNFYINDKFVDDIKIIIYFKREMYIVNDFRVKLFINNNIFEFKSISIYLRRRELIINNYKIIIFMFIKAQNDWIKKIIWNRKQVIVSMHTIMTILLK